MNELIALLQRDANAANAFGALASAVAAFLALIFSVVAIWISMRNARAQERHNELTVRPLAEVTVADFEDSVRVKLLNNGTGPMILKAITVSDGKDALSNLIDWMPDLPHGRAWTNFSKNFASRTLAAGSELVLVELTEMEDEVGFARCRDVVREALSPLTVNVEYMDIYNNTMKPVRKPLDWFGRTT
jgi:hypothetical protein